MRKEKLRETDGITEKWCPKCERWLARDTAYSPKRGGNEKVHSWCRECCSGDVTEWRKRKGRWVSPLAGRLQRITSALSHAGSALRTPYLRALYEKQNGCCHYTGVPMLLMTDRKNDPLVMSLDRVDSSKGYVEGNVVLCCYGINCLKGRHGESGLYEILAAFYLGAKKLGKV